MQAILNISIITYKYIYIIKKHHYLLFVENPSSQHSLAGEKFFV